MIFKTIENEITEYRQGYIDISEGNKFSQYKLVNRLALYMNKVYPSGKIDSQGKYKYWFDIISPRVDAEVKNIDFDTKDITLYSEGKNDTLPVFFAQAGLREWMTENGQASELNEFIEDGTSWGNVVWKKIEDGYEQVDLKNFYVVNQTARSLEETPAIERHILTQSKLREKKDVWNNVEEVIKSAGKKEFQTTSETNTEHKKTLYYEVYERNGEVSEKELFEAQGVGGGKEDKYLLAKIIVVGLGKSSKDEGKYVLYAEEIKEMPYKEYHRGRYVGRWFRTGMYEILFDIQTRANEIGNQLARGLEYSSKTIYRSSDKLIHQNMITDMQNGDIIKSEDLQQVSTRMEGLDQLIADWNRLMELADKLCNSYEVVTGESLPSGTTFRLGAMQNVNANKLFDFIREKLALGIEEIYQDWVLPKVMKELKAKKILRLTGNSEYLKRYYKIIVDSWYVNNLIVLPPHTPEIAENLKVKKLEELMENDEAIADLQKEWFEDFKPRIRVVITGENVNITSELDTLQTFISLEGDPVRRTALIEIAMKKKGMDVEDLPKSEEMPMERMPQGTPQTAPQVAPA